MGAFQGKFDNRFCMWRPLSKFMSSLSITKIDLLTPPVFLLSEGRDKKFLECNQSEWAGVDSCFDDRFPLEVESKFLPLVLNELSALPPPSSPLKIPSDIALLGETKEWFTARRLGSFCLEGIFVFQNNFFY